MKPPLKILEGAPALRNYILPGLTSYLISEAEDGSKVRVFHSEREQVEVVAPHSHRYDFSCLVLQGYVDQRLWKQSDVHGDLYMRSTIAYGGKPGEYTKREDPCPWNWIFEDVRYWPAQEYEMKSIDVHSIRFSKGAIVLFKEGPPIQNTSVVLEPWCDGKVIPTFRTEPWMFQKGE